MAKDANALWIMVAGPYSSGAADDAQRERNLRVLNEAALAVFERGHVPIVGVTCALPLIACAGQAAAARIMMPLSLALSERCDAVLRIGGPSTGADAEVREFERRGTPVFRRIEDVPFASHLSP